MKYIDDMNRALSNNITVKKMEDFTMLNKSLNSTARRINSGSPTKTFTYDIQSQTHIENKNRKTQKVLNSKSGHIKVNVLSKYWKHDRDDNFISYPSKLGKNTEHNSFYGREKTGSNIHDITSESND